MDMSKLKNIEDCMQKYEDKLHFYDYHIRFMEKFVSIAQFLIEKKKSVVKKINRTYDRKTLSRFEKINTKLNNQMSKL